MRRIGVLVPVSEVDGKRHFTLPKGWQRAPRTPLNVAITDVLSFGDAGTSVLPNVSAPQVQSMAARSPYKGL